MQMNIHLILNSITAVLSLQLNCNPNFSHFPKIKIHLISPFIVFNTRLPRAKVLVNQIQIPGKTWFFLPAPQIS